MFRITEDPSSGSLVQNLAKITLMFLSCPLTWTWSMLWQHIVTRGVCVCVVQCLERYCQIFNSARKIAPPPPPLRTHFTVVSFSSFHVILDPYANYLVHFGFGVLIFTLRIPLLGGPI